MKEPQKTAECVKSPTEGSREKEKPEERRPTRESEKTPRKQPRDIQSATEDKSKTKSPKSPVNTQNGTVKRSRYGRPIVKPKRFQMP